MKCPKCTAMMAGVLLTLITVGHVLRAAMGWAVVIDTMTVPVWASWVTAVITGFLSVSLFRSACCSRCCCKKDGACDDKAGDKKACCEKTADAKPA